MDDNNKHIKPVKNFDFNKSKEKRFDFTKDEKPVRKNNILLWGLGAFLVIVVAVLFLFLEKDSSVVESISKTEVNSVSFSDNITESIDSTIQNNTATEKTLVDNSNVEATKRKDAITSVNMSAGNVEQMAWSVIRGNYDNNPIRRQKLGEDYEAIQDKVNELYRKGLVH